MIAPDHEPPPMVPSARNRVLVAGCFTLPGYHYEVCRAAEAVKLIEQSYRDGWNAALASQQPIIGVVRAGAALSMIIKWMPRDTVWTVAEAKRVLAARGVKASAKEIHNAIGYMNRKGIIKRISYGHYAEIGYIQ